uniref:Uncharacterized protein n=1 Tax=viral metagenome TaxID=1070528 RepID=A0A6C0LN21_9ZZZZ
MEQRITFKKENAGQVILAGLFIIYLIMGQETPELVSIFIDSTIGKVFLFIIVMYMFLNFNTVLAILALFVVFDLIRRSSLTHQNAYMGNKYQPSEQTKFSQFTALNQFPYTLEQEVIKQMVPTYSPGNSISKPSYRPILEDLHYATELNNHN